MTKPILDRMELGNDSLMCRALIESLERVPGSLLCWLRNCRKPQHCEVEKEKHLNFEQIKQTS